MPVYEFYCPSCNTIYRFLSRTVNTKKTPPCPNCRKKVLERQVSLFAMTGRAKEQGTGDDLPVDEAKMEQALATMAQEASGMNEDDPRQAAQLMRKLSQMTGMELGSSMEEALRRLEAGEDPEKIEEDMGDLLDGEEPFLLSEDKGQESRRRGKERGAPRRDEKLYEM